MYSDAEKKVAHLSTQLAFKNQELLDKDIVRAPPPAPAAAPIPAPATPPAAVPAAAAAVPTQPMHTPEKMIMDGAAHPEEGSESQQEATDLEEAVEEPYAPAAQRFKVSKATQRSPQKRKAKTVRIDSREQVH